MIRNYFWIVIPTVLTVCAAVFGSLSLYWLGAQEHVGIVELLYVYIRYSVNLFYLMLLLFLVSCYVVRYGNFMLKKYEYKRALAEMAIRFLCGTVFAVTVFGIRGYGYRTLVQNFMRDNRSEYLFWCLILLGYLVSFVNSAFLRQYVERQEKE